MSTRRRGMIEGISPEIPASGRSRLNRLVRPLANHWPALVATALLLVLMGVEIQRVWVKEGGRYVYPIDDVYMHLAVAKNLVQHGSWGVTSCNGFCHCISSLIWPWLVALSFALFGVHEYYPVILNAIAAIGMLFYAGGMIRRATGSGWMGMLVLCAVVFLTPLTAVVLLGMEHSLQIFVSVVFVDLAARLLAKESDEDLGRRDACGLCVTGFLLVTTRYEGLFLIAIVGLLLLCRQRRALALTLGTVAGAPLVIFGLIAVAKGWAFFPTSLLLKGNTRPGMTLAGLGEYFGKGYTQLRYPENAHFLMIVMALTVALGASLQRKWTLWNHSTLILLIIFVATLEHLHFASLGWFYRYEAYLIVLTMLGIAIDIGQTLPRPAGRYWLRAPGIVHAVVLCVAGLLFGAALWERAVLSLDRLVIASYNIYEQQYQMGRFIRQFYNGRGVAANDIGAVTFLGDPRLLDTAGLANLEVLRAKLAKTGSPEFLRRLCEKEDIELAMVYDDWNDWYHGPLPEWVPVGRWTIPDNTICGSPTVTFYATNMGLVPRLTRELQAYARNLPTSVIQDGLYVGRCSFVGKTHGPVTDSERTFYWTSQRAEFTLYPTHGEAIGSDETTLPVSYLPTMDDQRIEIFFNDRLVSDVGVTLGGARQWKTVQIKTKWLPGKNLLAFSGHGSLFPLPAILSPLMYKIMDPLQVLNPDGTVTKPGIPADLP